MHAAGHSDTDEEAYLKFRPPYISSAIAWALSYYKESNPRWEIGEAKIPLVIDVGCGSGQLTAPLSDYCDRVIGVDISASHLELADVFNDRPNIEYVRGSAQKLSDACPRGGADMIVSTVAAHMFACDEFYAEARKCLRPGGVLFSFGCWYPGFQHTNYSLRTALTDFWLVESACAEVMSNNEILMKSYETLYCPVKDISRRSRRITAKVTRDDVRNYLTANRHLLKRGDWSIEEFLQKLSANKRLDLICDMFALQATLSID